MKFWRATIKKAIQKNKICLMHTHDSAQKNSNLLKRKATKWLNWINQTGFLFTYSQREQSKMELLEVSLSLSLFRRKEHFELKKVSLSNSRKAAMMRTFERLTADKRTAWPSIMRVVQWHCPAAFKWLRVAYRWEAELRPKSPGNKLRTSTGADLNFEKSKKILRQHKTFFSSHTHAVESTDA